MFQKRHRQSLTITAVFIATLSTLPASAHHGYTGEYDAKRPIYIEGSVQKVDVAYPHVEMTIQVTQRAQMPATLPKIAHVAISEVMKIMTVAAPGTYALQVAGLQTELQGRIAAEDKIALVALQNCLPPNQYRTRWVRIAGRALHELEQAGALRMQYGSIQVLDVEALKRYGQRGIASGMRA